MNAKRKREDSPEDNAQNVPSAEPPTVQGSEQLEQYSDASSDTSDITKFQKDNRGNKIGKIESKNETFSTVTKTETEKEAGKNIKSLITKQNKNVSWSIDKIKIENDSDEEEAPKRRTIQKKNVKSRSRQRNLKKPKGVMKLEDEKTDEVNKIHITMMTTDVEKKNMENRTETIKSYFDCGRMTYRVMKRANFIIEMVKQEKVIVDLAKLIKMLRESEQNEGYKVHMDKKSLMRLIFRLSQDGYVKFRKAKLESDKKQKYVCFICDPSIDDDHPIITSILEQSKMKFFIASKDTKSDPSMVVIEEKDLPKNSTVKSIELKEKVEKVEKEKYVYDRYAGKQYGLCPKFVRSRAIHEFLFYLTYEEQDCSPITDPTDIEDLLKSLGQSTQLIESDQITAVYNAELSWKMFVPPLPEYSAWGEGWSCICDILLRLPLSIFIKAVNVTFAIPGLQLYLDHPLRRHYLLKNLPPNIRNGLMYARKYIFTIHDIIVRLCHMGLVQFGPQHLKEKDQVFIYLNRKTSLLNTVSSPAAYNETADMPYEKKDYYFGTLEDVENYWFELWSICTNTNLGSRNSASEQYVIIEQATTKPILIEATAARTNQEVYRWDGSAPPGDGRGAAGLDSALFAHLKRNWHWIVLPKHNKIKPEPQNRVRTRTCQRTKRPTNKPREAVNRRRIIRRIAPKKKCPRKPHYDEKDRQSLKKLHKLRTDWTEFEDNVLLLCWAACMYLCPNRRRQTVEHSIMRDVLHQIVSYSDNKTSRSCQRRITYIIKHPRTRRSAYTCLEEIHLDESIAARFGQILKKYHPDIIPTERLNIAFVELVGYMNRKFSNQIPTVGKPTVEIPNSYEELRRMYHINIDRKKYAANFSDITSVNDVYTDILRSVVHSVLCCDKDKTSWGMQLSKIHQQYPEMLLRNILSKMRINCMISVKKAFLKMTSMIPFAAPFQLSISYYNQLQSTNFNYQSFDEANRFLRMLFKWVQERNPHPTQHSDNTPKITNDKHEEERIVGASLDTVPIPDETLHGQDIEDGSVDEFVEHTDETTQSKCEKSNRHKWSIESSADKGIKKDSRMLTCDDEHQNNGNFETQDDNLQNDNTGTSDEPKDECDLDAPNTEHEECFEITMSDNGTSMLTMDVLEKLQLQFMFEHPEQVIILDPVITTNASYDRIVARYNQILQNPKLISFWEEVQKKEEEEEENYPDLTDNVAKIDLNSTMIRRSQTRIAFHMMRAEMCEGIDKNAAQHIHDYFVVKASKVFLKIPESSDYREYDLNAIREKHNIDAIVEKVKSDAVIPEACSKITSETVKRYLPHIKDVDFEYIEKLRCFIYEKGQLGCSLTEVKRVRPDSEDITVGLKEVLDLLQSLKIIVRSGTVEFRYVHFDFRSIWTINVDRLVRLEKEKINMKDLKSNRWKGKNLVKNIPLLDDSKTRYLLYPWIRLDGSLNRRVLDCWLGALVSTFFEVPAISLHALAEKFTYLKPTEVCYLVDLLCSLQCVELIKLQKPKVTLFSSEPDFDFESATIIDDPKLTLIEPKADILYKFAIFIGEKSYTTNFTD